MHVLPCLRSSALVAVIGTALALVAASAARAADGTWAVDADGLWSETTNWQGGVLASGSGSTAFFNQVDLTADRAVQLDVDYTLTNLVFGDSGSDPDSNWTLGNNGLSANNLILAGTTPTITVESATTTIQAVIEGSSGLTKAGAGALVLSGANTFTGMTTITNSGSSFVNGNRLTLANPTGAALSGSVTIGNDTGGTTSGAVLFMNNANQFGPDSVVTINNPTSGYGYFILNGRSQTVRGIVAETARSPQVIENSDTAAVGATTLTLNAAAGDAHVFRGSLQRTWNGGANVGALNLVKTGAGTQTLAGTHILKQGQNTTDNYIGNVTVNQGTLVFENATSAGSGNAATSFTVAAGATLEFAISTGVTHNLGSTAAGGTGLAGAGTLRKTGPGILALSNQGSSTFAVNVALSAGGLIDVQAGTLRNGGWQGQTWSNNRASLAIASGASFDVWDGTSPVVDALTGAGSVLKGGGTGSVSRTLTVGIANGSGTFSGTIDDAGSGSNTLSLTKTGTGTQTLSGANTYRGTTVISSGILAISNNTALGATSGNTTIAATGSSTGPQLSLSGGITSAEPISITGNSAQNQYVGVITNTSGTNTLSGAITLASPSGGIRLSSGGGELILSGTISQTGTTRTLTLQATGGAALTVNNAIANNGGALFVINTGVTTLKGASTAIGATTIAEGGYLKLGVTNAIRDNQNLTIGSPWNFAGSD